MENKNPPSPTFKVDEISASIQLLKKDGDILSRGHHQASLLEKGHNANLFLSYGRKKKKRCEEGTASRLDIVVAQFLYPHLFTNQQQKILKEALGKCTERLYTK